MNVFPILDPVQGEQILAVQPGLQPSPDPDWRQRLQYFSGRALTHTALGLEQEGRSGHLATLGQAVSPGVVTGLEASAAVTEEGVVILIAAGMGIAASGEIVQVNRNQQVLLDDIRVFAPAAMLGGEDAEGASVLGDTLGTLRAAGASLPEAMVLVLQPAAVVHFSQEASTDPCDIDPSDAAYANWQWVDGCRLVLYAWDPDLSPLPVAGSWRRNRIAYAVFDAERNLSQGEFHPWMTMGVPIGLIGLDTTLHFAFVDRNAVVRWGGRPWGQDVPIAPAGDRFLWQARFEQFNEHLVEWIMNTPGLEPEDIKAGTEFRHLPPIGVLPKEAVASRQQLQHFFPPSYSVQARALPYEQLDLAIQESASLLPFDLNTPDRVEVLVPVPQEYFDPKLLKVEVLDPEFNQAIVRFTGLRDEWLGRRMMVRKKAAALYQALKGRPLRTPADDPNAVDSLEQPREFEKQLVKRGDSCRYFRGTIAPPGNWTQIEFDANSWNKGETSLGYSTTGLGTSLEDMPDKYLTVFFRHRFVLGAMAEAHRYTLCVTTQGGFYAYLNGRLLSSANVIRPDYSAPAAREQSLQTRFFELGELKGRLVHGDNVLAVQAHNVSKNAEAFSVSVELLDTEDSFGTTERSMLGQTKMSVPFGQEEFEVDALVELNNILAKTPFLSEQEVAKLEEVGIEEYVEFLKHKVDQANDRIEFGFLRLRTDMYRVRQMMLGNEVGTKLATSPALAEIAKGQSAVATKNELSSFYQRIKQAKTKEGGDADGGDISPTDSPTGGGDRFSISKKGSMPRGETFFSGELSGRGLKESSLPEDMVDRDLVLRKRELGLSGLQDPGAKLAAMFEQESSSGSLFKFATTQEVGEQNPVIGKVQDFNNVTVGERLEESSANVSYMAGLDAKAELLTNLLQTDISIDDLKVPGMSTDKGELSFAEIRADKSILNQITSGTYDPVIDDDESGFFNAGIRALENVVGVLRLIEGRVQAYHKTISRCRETMQDIQEGLNKADQRLKTIGDELAERRHDVSVARALKAEEQARIEALNNKRDKLLQNQVPFLLFRRPRTVDIRLQAPVRSIHPDLSDQPLPLCDLSEVETPEAVAAMLDLVRDGPMKWFTAVNSILEDLSRLSDLQVTLSRAKNRAGSKFTMHPFLKMNFQVPDLLLQGIGSTVKQSQKRVAAERDKTRAIDPASFERFGWQEAVKRDSEVVSLGDVLDGHHGRMEASQRAARELEMFSKVATCLYVRFSEVPAGIRLDWAQRVSQFDQPVNLRNLYSLPRFGELDFIERHDMQRLVDWLYGRVFSTYGEAQQTISDLIRVALLTASHSPVNELIAGYLPEPSVIQPGSLVKVVVDLARVRVGMAVSMVSNGAAVVRGRVKDISGGQVGVQAHTVVGGRVQLESGARVQISQRSQGLG